MATYKYDRYKVLINPEAKKTQGLRAGDVVRRQYFDNPNLIYSLMVVLETGTDIIGGKDSHYFIGALIEGDEPQNGELLDFIRVTNLFDTDRGGALYLTASDNQAPYMDVIDGLAFENSLCYPYMGGGKPEQPDKGKYSCMGEQFLTISYKASEQEAARIFSMVHNDSVNNGSVSIGLMQSLEKQVSHPQRLIISFKTRASKELKGVQVSFGYTNKQQTDATDTIDIGTNWQYNLFMPTVDHPAHYQRSFFLDLTGFLKTKGEWCEIADLNIVLQSDIATFANATKARIGKITGVIDPVFGILEGYGAYFQNMYATKNVNIAGTLTAGDENGFSSTFYVGKIHKNVIINSIDCVFADGSTIEVADGITPVGIGKVWKTGTIVRIDAQTAGWREKHIGQKYIFSFWIKAEEGKPVNLYLYQDEHEISSKTITGSGTWQRYYFVFIIQDSLNPDCKLRLDTSIPGILITAPQLEAGITPSQYQPTDATLSYIEDYGAWFNKGGIGGTIQNPLLKLNEDGSISSRNNSFVIKPDGTGHFANGRFKWTQETITLQDVTIKWEDFDDQTKENLSAITVNIVSNTGFTIKNNQNDVSATAKLYRGGIELDISGQEYTYLWSLWNRNGTAVIKTIYGKTVTVSASEVVDTAVLSCEVLEND